MLDPSSEGLNSTRRRYFIGGSDGRKVSDEFTVPLCRGHHRELHHCGDEAAWWRNAGVDPSISARELWLETHPVPVATADLSPGRTPRSSQA